MCPLHPWPSAHQAPGPSETLHAGGMGHRVPEVQAPSTCIESGHTVGRPGLVAGQLHGIQSLVICGEAGEGAEAHVAQGRRQEARTQVWAARALPCLLWTSHKNTYIGPRENFNKCHKGEIVSKSHNVVKIKALPLGYWTQIILGSVKNTNSNCRMYR